MCSPQLRSIACVQDGFGIHQFVWSLAYACSTKYKRGKRSSKKISRSGNGKSVGEVLIAPRRRAPSIGTAAARDQAATFSNANSGCRKWYSTPMNTT